jgi:hypothetical protein
MNIKTNTMKTLQDYTNKVNEMNAKYNNLATLGQTYDNKLCIEISTVDKCKTVDQMGIAKGYKLQSGFYRC